MTTIAWDGIVLAADKQCSYNHGFKASVTKIFRIARLNALIGFCGDEHWIPEVCNWFEGAEQMDRKPIITKEDNFSAILIEQPKESSHHLPRVSRLPRSLVRIPIQRRCLADGSGMDFAHMALHLGLSSVEAIIETSKMDSYTGMGVDWIEFASGVSGTITFEHAVGDREALKEHLQAIYAKAYQERIR